MSKHILILLLLCGWAGSAIAQSNIKFQILDSKNKTPLVGATVYISEDSGAISDENGIATIILPNEGKVSIRFSFIGYETLNRAYQLPLTTQDLVLILLEEKTEEMEEIIVTTTRTSRSIETIPTRIEFLGEEELVEKSVMRSANIAMLLRESTGIQMQITSPSSANQSIRIQGLDGRYTQLMKDGFPLYGGFAGGLSIMQIPPLDLQQVEVIKGSNSTLYGGGAIAGLVNLVSIRPSENPLTKVMLDQTNAGGTTLNTFLARKKGQWSMTLFGSGHLQQAYDPNDDNFSDLPKIESFTFNPIIFFNPNKGSEFRLALGGTFENRIGGNLDAVEREEASSNEFAQENETRRLTYQLSYKLDLSENRSLSVKNSYLHFDRKIGEFNYGFDGEQIATFSEIVYNFGKVDNSWVIGANLYTDKFKEGNVVANDRSYDQTTTGIFIQQNARLDSKFFLESGLRWDYNNDYGSFFLPRASLLYKTTEKLSMRLGGGLGYKLPTVFTEDTERLSFRGLTSLNLTNLNAVKSYGGNYDINYSTAIGSNWTFSFNQLFFHTQLEDPIVLRSNQNNDFNFENADGPVSTQGFESNIKVTYKDFKFFLNYAFIDTQLKYDNINEQKPLTAKHNIGSVLVYEVEDKWRVGLEAYYMGRQFRTNFTQTEDFWITGLMAMRKLEKISLYVNFENFIDTRQSQFENINLGNSLNPSSLDIWAPMDGFIINGGIILELK